MRQRIIVLVTMCMLGIFGCSSSEKDAASENGRWSAQRAWQWYNRQPWLVGCNFSPSTAINQLEMWQQETFDPETIDRELGWAHGIGMNFVRVYLHDMLWIQDKQGLLERIETFLQIADKHDIKVMFVLLDSCWNPRPQLGRQPDPVPHVHNSGWVQSPHIDLLKDPARYDELKDYVTGILTKFKEDDRVLLWDLYNEPGNINGPAFRDYELENKQELALQLMQKLFVWAREVSPSQPISICVWNWEWKKGAEVHPLNQYALDHSDVVTFHTYLAPEEAKAKTLELVEYGRPILCTEYMSRTTGNTFAALLPFFKQHRIGACNWGFVAGKTQTQYPWESWDRTFNAEPEVWFHDILRPDGTPFDPKEVDMIKALTLSVLLPSTGADEISFASLLEEMTDRRETARWPSPEYECGQFSSYDRHSTTPETADWWANWDRSYFLRIEEHQGREEHVLMDADGPGAVVRIWMTWHGPDGTEFSNGLIRVYLDHSAEPTIEAPAADFMDKGYLAGPPLSQGVSPQTEYRLQGHNLYVPIPYAEHCKITYETKTFIDAGGRKGEALYYLINYRRYTEGTSVQTFSMADLKTHAALLDKTQRLLKDGPVRQKGKTTTLTGSLAPHTELSVDIAGQQAIRSMHFKLDAAELSQALRSVVLKIEFDGKKTIWCPVGDFFGTGYRIHPYTTWVTDVRKDGTLSCYWVMPFQKQARVTLENLGEQPVEIAVGDIVTDAWQWDDRSLYFHAAWKQWSDIRTRANPVDTVNGASDLNWITIQGRGKYVGDVLTLFNNAPYWWGEGDEKIYIDGESFPSHFGTGTEDYYGYAWCRPEPFSAPFHAQPCGEGNLDIGFSVNCRFRSLDAIPFTTSLKFDMELWHWAQTTMDYAPTVFWYGDFGAAGDTPPMPREAQRSVLKQAPTATTYRNPIIEGIGPADPTVIKYKGDYYLYPTWNGAGYNVFVSQDLVNWVPKPMCYTDPRGGLWAPDVFYHEKGDGKIYLYYTANNPDGGKLIGVAVGDHPLGPFVDKGNLAEDNVIDAHLFADEDGKLYLYYVQTGDPFIIFVQPMKDPLTKEGQPQEVLRPTADWEQRRGRVTEGPWMLKRNGIYYLMYSGSGADGPEYAIGYATSRSPQGPFVKYENNPIVQQGNGVYGPGHHSVIEGPEGHLWMVYHQQNSEKVGWDRFLAIDPIWFDEKGVLHAKVTRGTDETLKRDTGR